MADMKALEELLNEIQKPLYYRGYKKRDQLVEDIRTAATELRKSQVVYLGKKIIRQLHMRVSHKNMTYSTLHKLVEILRIYDSPDLYLYFQDIVLKGVRENKYASIWFLVLLLKIKHQLDGDTNRLQDIYIERYLMPNRNNRIDSEFFKQYITELPFYNRSKLFRHCISYRSHRDTYGDDLLGIFFDLNPEYKKYTVLE